MSETTTPVKSVKASNVEAALWENKGTKGTFLTASAHRSYKDSKDEWKKTSSFRVNDIPALKLCLSKLYEYAKLEHKTTFVEE